MGANASPNTEFPIAIAQQLVEGTCAEPFRWLGLHRVDDHWHLTVFAPGAEEVAVLDAQLRLPQAKLARIDGRGLLCCSCMAKGQAGCHRVAQRYCGVLIPV